MSEPTTLLAIRAALEHRLAGELMASTLFTSLNTRLILRTGVNLKLIQPEQNQDRELVSRVLEALRAMGFGVGS
jgi:hypothetical protein